MGKEVYLDPSKYQEQVDKIQSMSVDFAALKYALEKYGVRLECVDKIVEAAIVYEEAMEAFNELERLDVKTYNSIRAAWMKLDTTRGSKTAGELIMDLFKS